MNSLLGDAAVPMVSPINHSRSARPDRAGMPRLTIRISLDRLRTIKKTGHHEDGRFHHWLPATQVTKYRSRFDAPSPYPHRGPTRLPLRATGLEAVPRRSARRLGPIAFGIVISLRILHHSSSR